MAFPYKNIPALAAGQGYCPTCAGLRYVAGPHTCPTCKGLGKRNDSGVTGIAQVSCSAATFSTVPDPVVNSAAFDMAGIGGSGYKADGQTSTITLVKISDSSVYPPTTSALTPTGFTAHWDAGAAPTVAANDYLVQIARSDGSRDNFPAHLTVT